MGVGKCVNHIPNRHNRRLLMIVRHAVQWASCVAAVQACLQQDWMWTWYRLKVAPM